MEKTWPGWGGSKNSIQSLSFMGSVLFLRWACHCGSTSQWDVLPRKFHHLGMSKKEQQELPGGWGVKAIGMTRAAWVPTTEWQPVGLFLRELRCLAQAHQGAQTGRTAFAFLVGRAHSSQTSGLSRSMCLAFIGIFSFSVAVLFYLPF